MNGIVIKRVVPVLLLSVAIGGCVSQDRKRMTVLEQANYNLTERLNLTRTQLDELERERGELNQRLLAALDEVSGLHDRLTEASAPVEAAPGWTAVPGGAMIAIEGSVLFAPGKVTVRKGARRVLDGIASTIQGEYADKDILVCGHTDKQPIKKSGWVDNYQLSSERALAVVRYLRDRGVSPARLVACGCGEHRPRSGGTSASDHAANRRVEIFAIEPLPRG